MEREADGKFKSSAPPGASASGEDASGAGESRYEEPAGLLTTPVAAASMPALPSEAGYTTLLATVEALHVRLQEQDKKSKEQDKRSQEQDKKIADMMAATADAAAAVPSNTETTAGGATSAGGAAEELNAEEQQYLRQLQDRDNAARRQEASERDIEEKRYNAARRQEQEQEASEQDIKIEEKRYNAARRQEQEASERGIEEERSRLRIDGMRRQRAIATLGNRMPILKFKLQTLSEDPAQVHGQIKSSLESQLLGSFSGQTVAAYAKACATIAESAESLEDLSPNFDPYEPDFHYVLATAKSDDKVWKITEAAAAHKAVSEQYSILAAVFRTLRFSSPSFNTAVTQAEKAPEKYTSGFVPDVLEMMKLQAPLNETDTDPAMAAEAALTDEHNFIIGEGRYSKFQNITPGQHGFPRSNAGAVEYWLANQRAVSAKAPGNETASKQLILQMLLRALPSAIKKKAIDERRRQLENGMLEDYDTFLVRIKRMAAFADLKNQERGDNGAEEARTADAKKKTAEETKLKANTARRAPGK